ncbi:MAG: ATP-binding protein [Granulosicoccus sp.]
MGIDPTWLFAIVFAYLGCLFVIAWCTDKHLLPEKLIRHPLIYSLSLGVYATSWTYYGSVGLADTSGFAFLTIYLGLTGAFILGPYLLMPILRLCSDYQLTSIADLLAFRYGGRATGFVVTLFLLIGILPYISLQIHAVTESIQILSREATPDLLALVFCIAIILFAILFGARHLTPREKHNGLVVAIAFESAVKLVALVIAGVFVATQVFDSPVAMTDWAENQPEMLASLHESSTTGMWSTLLLLAFCAAFMLPRQYHMTFVENQNSSHLCTAYWLFPLYLLVLNLPIIPILFAGKHLSLNISPDFYVLGIALTLGKDWLAILVFIGGVSAASAMMIVTTLALSSMCLNNFLLPATLSADNTSDFYRKLLLGRRLVITAIIAAGYGFFIIIELNEGLASLGLISFVAAAQLMPGIIGLLFWSRGTQTGFITGLSAGAIVWFILLILPLINPDYSPSQWFAVHTDIWTLSTFCTLSCNTLCFIVFSLLTQVSADETAAAQAVIENSGLSSDGSTVARSAVHYRYALQQALGNKVAAQELERALLETSTSPTETRSSELRLLHEQLERNLTGLLGPAMARKILRRRPIDNRRNVEHSPDVRLLERRLEASGERMRGLTKQLNELRQYLQSVLRQLPLGVCSLASNGNINIWNAAMHSLTGVSESDAYGKRLEQLDQPWGAVLESFASSQQNTLFRQRISISVPPSERSASVNLHKAKLQISAPEDNSPDGLVILMEDRTSLNTLESELAHSERLASIGRLAAGVAHEIGNPLTGIASIAQNLRHDLNDIEVHNSEHEELIADHTHDILRQVERINSIVRSLLTFSHAETSDDLHSDSIDIADCIHEALRLVRLSPDTRRLLFETSIAEGISVDGDSNQLMQVFVNLINNACDASPDGACVNIEGTVNDNEISIAITDQGQGIAAAVRDNVFEPFFTTKPVGKGTGLGLFLAYSIVANHNGRVRIGDSESGTRMIVSLPLSPRT